MFKVNIKKTEGRRVFLLTLTIFALFSSASIVDFVQVIVSWK